MSRTDDDRSVVSLNAPLEAEYRDISAPVMRAAEGFSAQLGYRPGT